MLSIEEYEYKTITCKLNTGKFRAISKTTFHKGTEFINASSSKQLHETFNYVKISHPREISASFYELSVKFILLSKQKVSSIINGKMQTNEKIFLF